ncbi:radical SAM family heme chaperone HemW [Insolitispirillum peregrinum]|uniref:Heme chaperone HemW n=1 Tax=Insolitispirillum peregrinum TaxID=80876 RepID=A0A1N7JQ79_9PROT|nr:radical SAM family heme chaperone HemW [Insolitispirillum peregrinum]SIS51513.1 oxygen-independent coproporphyrinogen-3 oxidase [Insolitispirillum peregrinum]
MTSTHSQGREGFGLYIHWPFCLSKCPYCDFNSHAARQIDQDRWRRALITELDHAAAEAGREDRLLTSIFFGGGTPSLMAPDTTAALIEHARSLFRCSNDLEITLEANPSAVDRDRFAAFRQAGVNRVSLGIQSLREDSLRFLERHHDRQEALTAIETAASLFPRYSFDLIYARPGQTVEEWRSELAEALTLAGDHLSLYQLTIEQGTRFFNDYAKGAFILPDDEQAVALYEVTQQMMTAAGRPAYEVSNHARPGEECRHNLTYWRGGDYLAVGPGAHGRLTLGDGAQRHTLALRRHRAPEIWLSQVEANGHATREKTILSAAERREELILMGLRLYDGLDPALFARLGGQSLDSALSASGLAMLRDEGLIATDGPLRVTPQGMLCLNSVIAALLP